MQRNLRLLILSIFSATALGATAYAADGPHPSTTKALQERRPGTVERAFKLGFTRQRRLFGQAQELETLNKRLSNSSHAATEGHDSRELHLPMEWLKQGQEHLAKLPPEVRSTAVLDASMRSKYYTAVLGREKLSTSVTFQNYRDALQATKPHALSDAHRPRLEALRAKAMGELDHAFTQSRPQFLARLQTEPVDKLVATAQRLIHELDEQTSGREIQMQKTGETHVSGSSSHSSSRQGFFTGSSSHSTSSFSADSVAHSLVITASHYQVRLANTESAEAGTMKKTDLDPVQARALAEKVLKTGDIIRAIKLRDPARGSAFGQWERESTVTFVTPTRIEDRYRGTSMTEKASTIQIARAAKDLSKLGEEQFMTPTLAGHLGKETSGRQQVKFGAEDVFGD